MVREEKHLSRLRQVQQHLKAGPGAVVAHNLALGRNVLFVTEKRAALEVVHRRLAAHGPGPFCLELHSNKASKQDALRQLDAAWSTSEVSPHADGNAARPS